jgi:hypothetical protein
MNRLMIIKIYFTFIILLLACCSSKEASHLPSLWELPSAIIGTTIENTMYGYKRSKVKKYVITHYNILKYEIQSGEGIHLDTLLENANIKISKRAEVKKKLQEEYVTMFNSTLLATEAVMQTFEALYLPKEKTKTMHGFSYTQAYNIIQSQLSKHFDVFRLSLEHQTTTGIVPLVKKLHITDSTKQKHFYTNLWKRYDPLIIEPVVVTIMAMSN